MTLRYRDLPATAFGPVPIRHLEGPKGGDWTGLSISLQGDLHLTYFRKGIGSTLHDEDGREIALKPPDGSAFWFAKVHRFADGRWLVIEGRTKNLKPNAFVFEPDGSFSHAFHAGDGIETVLIDHSDRIWIGYFAEAIFSAVDFPPDHKMRRFGPNGLVRVDDRGEVEFGFNERAGDRVISDIYAMTVDDEDRIWLCPYHEFFVASVDDDEIDVHLERAPVAGARAMTGGPEHFVFFGGYDRGCMIAVVERRTQRLRLIQLRDQGGGPLSLRLVATRGESALAVADDRLYRLDLDVLLDVLGPWRDDNSSSVASAIRYMEEESSYAENASIIVLTGKVRNTQVDRPPENQPRDDDCGKP